MFNSFNNYYSIIESISKIMNNFANMQFSDLIQIIIAIITFLGIIVSIIITIVTIRKNSMVIKEASRAQIVFYIDYNPACNMYFLIIKNFGKSIGKLLEIKTNPKIDWSIAKFSQDISALTEAKNIMLAPNQKVSSWFDFEDYPDRVFEVEILYESLGEKYVEKYTIDLNYIDNIDWIFPSVKDDCSSDNKAVLYKINNSIRDLTDKFR